MNPVYEFFELAASFIEVYILYLIYNDILRQYRRVPSQYYDICLSVVEIIIIKYCNNIALASYFTMFVFLFYVSITAQIMYKTNYIILFSLASFYAVCVCCVDFFIITLMSSLWNGDKTLMELISHVGLPRTLMLIGAKTPWIIAYFSLRRFFYRISLKINQAYTVLIISFIGFFCFVFLVNQTMKAFHYSMTGVWLLLVMLLMLLFFIGYFIIVQREEKMKLNFSEVRNNLLEEKYQSINEIYTSNSKLYHDLNNHLNVLYQMLDAGNADEAKGYIEEISKPIRKLSKDVWTGVDVVDVIINSKIEKMQELGIVYHINAEFPRDTKILPHDICTILGNLLDNAIEAAGKLEEPGEISLTIRRIHHFVMIQIINSCAEVKKDFVHYPETTKQDRKLHGWGLPSVMETVEKYNGTLKCIHEKNTFAVRIALF